MIYLENHWYIGNREVTQATIKFRESLYQKAAEFLNQLYNWPDTNDLGIDIDITTENDEDSIYTITGPISNLLLFLYNWMLEYSNYTLTDILKDKSFDINNEIYLKNVR